MFLTFVTDHDWGELFKKIPEPSEVCALLSLENRKLSGAQMRPSTAVAGFLRLLEHMARSEMFFEGRNSNVPESFVHYLGMMQAWRLPLDRPEPMKRFKELVTATAKCIRQEPERLLQFEFEFEQVSERLAGSWVRDHPRFLSATA